VDLATSLGFEAYAQAQSITTDDHAEGVRAFLEKRSPRFPGS
jgi:enoyl-CoA hydratase/carnithine racemase